MKLKHDITVSLFQNDVMIALFSGEDNTAKARVNPQIPVAFAITNRLPHAVVVYLTVGTRHVSTVMESMQPVGYVVHAGQEISISHYRHNDVEDGNIMWDTGEVVTFAVHAIDEHTVGPDHASITDAPTALVEQPVWYRLGQAPVVKRFRQQISVNPEPLCEITITQVIW